MEVHQRLSPPSTAVWTNASSSSVIPNQTFPPPFLLPTENWTDGRTPDYAPGVAGILIPLIYIAVCIVGLIGNTLVIHIVLRYSQTESVTNIYILNLAIADELFMLGLPFLAVQNGLLSWPF